MKATRLTIGIGAIWLAILAGGAQAYIVDWKQPYKGAAVQEYPYGKTGWTGLIPYEAGLDWNRSIQMWQGVLLKASSHSRTVRGIALHLMHATGTGTVDLNVYEGTGVGGRLVSSTKLKWNTNSGEQWYAFKLNTPVILVSTTYTFSFENLKFLPPGGTLSFAVDEDTPGLVVFGSGFDAPFWQYNFASHPNGTAGGKEAWPWKKRNGTDTGTRGYNAGTISTRIAYSLLE